MKKLIKFFLHCTNHLIERVGGWEKSCIFKWDKNKDKDDSSSTQIPLDFEKCHTRILCKSNSRLNSTHTVNHCGCGFLFFSFSCQGHMGKGREKQLWLCDCTHTVNNCGCLIQWTIVPVGFSFFFLLSGSRGKRQWKNKKKWIIVTREKRKIIKK